MKVTFILKDLTDTFYNGNGGSIIGLLNMDDKSKYEKLCKLATGDLRHCISMKIGSSNAFRDRVDLNSITRRNNATYDFKIEPRKGYKLVTFDIR